ncbi:MAG: FG-GAP-like repeat-containing protein [candidate division WOR-3 bacterium]|nr:FG-GAP-like repeat-containing protein [candidate division WOR-3 bacterium]
MLNRIFEDNKKKVVGNVFCFALIHLFNLTTLFAQQTNNLEVIWQKTASSDMQDFGSLITSGDLNNDGFSDIVIRGRPQGSAASNAYIFCGGTQFDTIVDIIIKPEEGFGFAIHSDDINDDGFDDLILGQQHVEQVSIYLGGSPMDTIRDYILRGPHSGADFGVGISSGDINGDGYKDLIVGACGYYLPPVGDLAGRVYIYFGGSNFDTIPDVILNGGHHNDAEGFGSNVGSCGDVNNDNYEDVIIGALNFGPYRGRIYIYYGGNPMNTNHDVAMIGEGPNHHLGAFGVDGLRNINNFDYALTGTPFWPRGWPNKCPGKVYVFHGGYLMDSIPDIMMIGRTDSSTLGMDNSRAGLITTNNSDGIISGAPIEYNSQGTSYLWLGGSLLDTIPDAWLSGLQYDDGIGWDVASAGDVDGDGKDEVMVSNYASNYSPKRVWVCKYTGAGIEEIHQPLSAIRIPLEIRPNPARTQTVIRFPQSADRIELKVFDIAGKIVKIFKQADSRQNTEYREIIWDLRDENKRRVANGIYFIELTAEQVDSKQNTEDREKNREIRKIIVTK